MNGKDVGELAKEASKKKKSSSLVAEAQTETHADGLHTHTHTQLHRGDCRLEAVWVATGDDEFAASERREVCKRQAVRQAGEQAVFFNDSR